MNYPSHKVGMRKHWDEKTNSPERSEYFAGLLKISMLEVSNIAQPNKETWKGMGYEPVENIVR